MAITELLRAAITQELQRQGQAGIIVWYDQGGTLASVIAGALPEGAEPLRFDGSHLALRMALEDQDPQFERRWVVYIPEAAPRDSWLRDWELLGARWEMDLLELLHREAGLATTQTLAALLRYRPQNARELAQAWESLVGERSVSEAVLLDALLSLASGLTSWQIEQGVLKFLNGLADQAQLEARDLWAVFRERVADWTGWSEVPDNETALRQRLEASVLLSELVSTIPDLADRLSQVLPSVPKRRAVAGVAALWRSREEFRIGYLRAAQRVEQEYGLSTGLTVSEPLLDLETFYVVDDLWRKELMDAVAPDGSNFKEKAQRVRHIAEKRSSYFWGRQERAPYWEPMAVAAQLCEGSQKAAEAAEKLSHVDEFVQRYIAEDAWWRLDLWALELAAEAQALNPEERTRYAHPAWRAYGEYLDRVNRGFAEAVRAEGWQPRQPSFWSQYVTGPRPTAVFFLDALRYDLAEHLMAILPSDLFETSMSTETGVLPSITEVGMAALLPQADEGLQITVEDAGLQVRLAGEEVGSRQGRLAWLADRLAQRGKVVKLDEAEQSALGGVEILVIQSRDLDTFGTFAADLHPQGLLDLVDRIAQAMRMLKDRGFQRFLVTADHGFLYLPPGVQPQRMHAPEAKVRKHRFAIGGTREGCLVLEAEDLGLRGSEIFAFPVGLQVFGLPGQTRAFLHGGLSLQESVIPVLRAEAVAPVERVSVVMETPSQITSRIAVVSVRVDQPTLFVQPRRVQLEIDRKRSEIVELSRDQHEATIRIAWLGFDEPPPRQATIRLLDADSRQVLEELKVPVEIVV